MRRLVIDSNVWISALLFPASPLARGVERAVMEHAILVHQKLLDEIGNVLTRQKMRKYVSQAQAEDHLLWISEVGEEIEVIQRIRACRDPADNFLLEIAVNGRADALVTGDKDLLALHPFRSVKILSPTAFCKLLK